MNTIGALGGSAIGGLLGGSSQATSNSFDIGGGSNSGKSWNSSQGSSWEQGSGYSAQDAFNDSYAENFGYGESDSYGWSETNGTQASARDIERAKEANEQQYQFWKAQADYNASEAQKQRDFEEYMSNTAYQRAVKDLIKAGINPVMAAGMGGASTPAGAYANSGMAVAQKATTYANSASRQSSTSRSQQGGYSRSHGESHGESAYENAGGSQTSSTGGSIQNGINFNVGSSTSKSSGQSLIHDIGNGIGNAIGKLFGKK